MNDVPPAGPEARAISVPEDVEEAFEFLYAQGMTDGLPVIPPTRERVGRMIAAGSWPPAHVVAELPPRGGVGTIEKLAINAVMAGCRPEYFPVIVAAVEGMTQPQFNLAGVQTTTNPVAPFLLINGPVRRALDVNCGAGALGPGRRANATMAILTNRWKSMDRMAERMASQLMEVHGVATVPVYGIPINGAMSDEVRERVIRECDAAIVGLAN
jgi:hypothetical protein